MLKYRFVDLQEINVGRATRTGRIASSKRITKTLQKAVEGGEPLDFTFEDGSQGTIVPAMARMALQKYYSMSHFQQAKVSAYMRKSYKNFLASVKG